MLGGMLFHVSGKRAAEYNQLLQCSVLMIVITICFTYCPAVKQLCIKHEVRFKRWGRNGGLNNLYPPARTPAVPPLAFKRAAPL